MKAIVDTGAVNDEFLNAAKTKIVTALASVTTVEALASIVDTLSSLAKAKVQFAPEGNTKAA